MPAWVSWYRPPEDERELTNDEIAARTTTNGWKFPT
jgi:hypothetical protein